MLTSAAVQFKAATPALFSSLHMQLAAHLLFSSLHNHSVDILADDYTLRDSFLLAHV
jgi:hypothetical protein